MGNTVGNIEENIVWCVYETNENEPDAVTRWVATWERELDHDEIVVTQTWMTRLHFHSRIEAQYAAYTMNCESDDDLVYKVKRVRHVRRIKDGTA